MNIINDFHGGFKFLFYCSVVLTNWHELLINIYTIPIFSNKYIYFGSELHTIHFRRQYIYIYIYILIKVGISRIFWIIACVTRFPITFHLLSPLSNILPWLIKIDITHGRYLLQRLKILKKTQILCTFVPFFLLKY